MINRHKLNPGSINDKYYAIRRFFQTQKGVKVNVKFSKFKMSDSIQRTLNED